MIYSNILTICKKRKLSVRELERKCGIGNGVIRRWDDGAANVRLVKAVADYLGVSVDYLLREPEKNEKAASGGG